ncbi:hypothetical protein ACFY93_07510 [Streptomyces sp. NPDC008313]|uniref:hypothetical protein n=1 Tax=Streptomyces sp. NPDC008313 TaxID=3364826 RepID=UPI0036E26CA3
MGKGSLTSWHEGVIRWTARTDSVSVPESRSRALKSAVATASWSDVTLAGHEPLPDDLAPDHRTAVEARLARSAPEKDEVAREIHIRHLPLARVRLDHDSDRFFFVFPGPVGLKAVERPSEERVRRRAAIAVACLLLVVLVVWLVR